MFIEFEFGGLLKFHPLRLNRYMFWFMLIVSFSSFSMNWWIFVDDF